MVKKNGKIRNMTVIALGAVILVLTAWISVPFAVPFTLQTFGVAFVLFALGGKRGLLSIVVYIALGAIGIPVFSGFNSGFGALFGATGGYVVGFALWGCLYFALESFFVKKQIAGLAISFGGLIASYALGTLWYVVLLGGNSFLSALSLCVFPYIIPDVIKIILAYAAASRVRKALDN